MTQIITPAPTAQRLDLPDLEEALRAVDAGALLLPVWLLQKCIGGDREMGPSPFRLPHGHIHVIQRRRLLEIAEREHLPLGIEPPPGPTLILLARPEANWLAVTPAEQVLRQYWRLLFHARVDLNLQRQFGILHAASRTNAASERGRVQERIERIGRRAFNEARFVLQGERYLYPLADEREAYVEFAAVYLELHHFAPSLLGIFFPSLDDPEEVLHILGQDLDWRSLLQQTRLDGAAGHPAPERTEQGNDDTGILPAIPETAVEHDPGAAAARAQAGGNSVRAAILHMREHRAAGKSSTIDTQAIKDIEALVARLQAALEFDDAAAVQWREALIPLLSGAALRWWNLEERLLYDLQKVCVDHEREVYSVNVVEWLLERARGKRRRLSRPLVRPQPGQRLVLVCKHLQLAIKRLASVQLGTEDRSRLSGLLHHALNISQEHLRERFRPPLVASLEAAGLRPRNAPERVAEQKLIEELLDTLVRRGFLSFGSVRDAVSRNQLKLHDLFHGDLQRRQEPRDSSVDTDHGDQLLRIDRHLRVALDGVYRGGEAYLRFFQVGSSFLFATRVGRIVTRTVLLPLGGSLIILEAMAHLVALILHLPKDTELPLNYWSVRLLGAVFLMGVINWPALRQGVGRIMHALFRPTKWLFVDAPLWLAQRPAVRAFLRSRAARGLFRFGIKPLLPALILEWFLLYRFRPLIRDLATTGIYLALSVLLNFSVGRRLEQALLYWLRVGWTRVADNVFGGLFRLIAWFFGRLIEDFDRLLYAVDEWLRFRAGQKNSALWAKAAAGFVWFYIAYVARFCINLLVEPQVNPIKHFPVVTVSYKLCLFLEPEVAIILQTFGMKAMRANTTAFVILTSIPGIFGFLAWELKENWRLYRSNRPKSLRPVQVGHHGESLARLLRPGFHSGTIPKIFARLRRSEQRGIHASIHKQAEAIEHAREAVEQFLHRELITLLNQHPLWQATPVSLGTTTLRPTSILAELHCPGVGAESAQLCFEQRAGWILASVNRPGWTALLREPEARLLGVALLGLYKMAGVDLVGEQIESQFTRGLRAYEIRRKELAVWPPEGFEAEAIYPWKDGSMPLQIKPADPIATSPNFPVLNGSRLMLKHIQVDWKTWVRVWEPDPGSLRHETAQEILAGLCLLPSEVAQTRSLPLTAF